MIYLQGMLLILFFIFFAILLYGVFYYIGKALCKKVTLFKVNANKNNAIISSIILIPAVMSLDNEVLAYGIGYGFSPVIGTILIHFLVTKFLTKNKRKKEAFFSKDYYFGFLGIVILSYLGLLLPAN
tara:strand:+ start:44 stop:424 length:381 start_codon:yes stop_codon:yes gene_type:complete